jgi:hypothetical protein
MRPYQLGDAVKLIKSGNKAAAFPILEEVLLANPRDENAWLWLYACVEDVDQKRHCLRKALEINPKNEHARQALKKLASPRPAPARVSSPASEPEPAAEHGEEPEAEEPVAVRNRRNGLLGMVVLVLLFCLCSGIALFLVLRQFSDLGTGLAFLAGTLQGKAPALSVTVLPAPLPSPTVAFLPSATLPVSATLPPPSPTLSPAPTDTAAAVITQPVAAEELESYRMQGKMSGAAGTDIMSFSREWIKASRAQHRVTDSNGDITEIIIVDKVTWQKSDGSWTRLDLDQQTSQQGGMASPIANWQSLKPVGDETINGVPCMHYTVDEDASDIWGVQGSTSHISGDLWVANRADLPPVILSMKIHLQTGGPGSAQATATLDPSIAPGEAPALDPPGMTYDYEYEITEINPQLVIEAPQNPQ